MTISKELLESFNASELPAHCELLESALDYYDGANDADDFLQWYDETYIHNAEIIYYNTAMEYLRENDPSLRESLSKAADMGCTLESLNSEMLASLLLQDNLRELLYSFKDDLEEYFEAKEESEAV